MERGRTTPPLVTLEMLATALDMTVIDLLTGVDFAGELTDARCPFHIYTASPCDLASFPRKRESRGQEPWGLDACFRRHDVLLASDLRNRHLVYRLVSLNYSKMRSTGMK